MECYCCGVFFEDIIVNNKQYLLCPNCGYLKKVNTMSLEEQKKRYDFHVCDESYLVYMKGICDRLLPYLNKGLSLDFGCGKIHALSDILNARGNCCDYYDLFYYPEFPENKYINIIMIEVFEHLEDPFLELLKLKEKLDVGGRIIFITKVYPEDINNWWYLRDVTHVSFILEKTIRIWAEKLGMNLEINGDIFILSRI